MKQIPRLNNLNELKARQASLKAEQRLLAREIVNDGKSAITSLPMAGLMTPADPLKVLKVDGKVNPPAKFFSYLFPLVVNRTLFRHSGFFIKIITALVARKIGKNIGSKVAGWLSAIIGRYLQNFKSAKPTLRDTKSSGALN